MELNFAPETWFDAGWICALLGWYPHEDNPSFIDGYVEGLFELEKRKN